jgi:hypothetical protein
MIIDFDKEKFVVGLNVVKDCLSIILISISAVVSSFILFKMGFEIAARQVNVLLLIFVLVSSFILFLNFFIKPILQEKSKSRTKKKKVRK